MKQPYVPLKLDIAEEIKMVRAFKVILLMIDGWIFGGKIKGEIKKKVLSYKASQLSMFDEFLMNVANKVCDTYEYLINDLPYELKPMHRDKAEKAFIDLSRIKEQSTAFIYVICDMDFGSKNMDRVKDMIENIQSESEKFIEYLKNKKLKTI